jgi:hypothetical protein
MYGPGVLALWARHPAMARTRRAGRAGGPKWRPVVRRHVRQPSPGEVVKGDPPSQVTVASMNRMDVAVSVGFEADHAAILSVYVYERAAE